MELTINGVELEFDFYDVDTFDKFVSAYQVVGEELVGLEDKDVRESIVSQCGTIKKCFDSIFGEGTGDKVCGENMNLSTCIDAFEALTDAKIAQEEQLTARNKKMETKYAKYTGNRAQRRSKK